MEAEAYDSELGAKYSEVFEENLLQSVRNLRLRQPFTFQHNSNLEHSAKTTMELFLGKSLAVSEYPNQSSDLNLIKHLGRDLKMIVHRCFSFSLTEL